MLHIILLIKNSLQQQIHFNGNIIAQRAHDVNITSPQRRCNVIRKYNVASTSMQRHDVASTLRRRYIYVMCLPGENKWCRCNEGSLYFIFHAICLLICMKCKSLFSRKNKKNIKLSSAESAHNLMLTYFFGLIAYNRATYMYTILYDTIELILFNILTPKFP